MKILNDTLKNETGRYSRKSLTAFACLIMGTMYGFSPIPLIIIFDVDFKVDHFVFATFMSAGVGTIVLTVIDKMKKFGGSKHEQEN